MNFDFSDDQKMLRDQARKFLAEKCTDQSGAPRIRGRPRAMTRRSGRASPKWAGWARRSPRTTAAWASAISSFASSPRNWAARWRRSRSPRRSISSPRRSWWPAPRSRRRSCCPRSPPARSIGAFARAEGPGAVTPKSIRTSFEGGKLTGHQDRRHRRHGCALRGGAGARVATSRASAASVLVDLAAPA